MSKALRKRIKAQKSCVKHCRKIVKIPSQQLQKLQIQMSGIMYIAKGIELMTGKTLKQLFQTALEDHAHAVSPTR